MIVRNGKIFTAATEPNVENSVMARNTMAARTLFRVIAPITDTASADRLDRFSRPPRLTYWCAVSVLTGLGFSTGSSIFPSRKAAARLLTASSMVWLGLNSNSRRSRSEDTL